MTIRKALFWVHLAVGITAGSIIAIMCVTGAALAFERQIVAWAERDSRRVEPPPLGIPRLTLEELQSRFAGMKPGKHPSAITLSADPSDAVVFSVGRDETYYVNPQTGEVRQPASDRTRKFMRLMADWHRWLARSGELRTAGRAVTGACNVAFLFLALSGAILWWPRKWRTKGLRRSLWFLRDASGRARDWNWHNVIGFWLLPVLILLTASGTVLSYRWANNLVYRIAGEAPPEPGGGTRVGDGIPDRIIPFAPDARPLGVTSLMAVAQKEFPHWETITLLLDDGSGRENRTDLHPVLLSVKTSGVWPKTATNNLYLDPHSGAVLRREDFNDLTSGRRARVWLRLLHTGEALGYVGQLVAGLACIGACFLVYTGFALAWRRLRGEKKFAAGVEPSGLG